MTQLSDIDVRSLTVAQLLSGYGAILEELRQRGIVRSSNNPLSDYAELLFIRAFGWSRERSAAAGHDATDGAGVRYQVKGRRVTPRSVSRQVSAIRNLEATPFDQLAGLLVDERFEILRAAIIPFAIIRTKATYVAHTNSWRFLLRDDVWDAPGVRDVTKELREAAVALSPVLVRTLDCVEGQAT